LFKTASETTIATITLDADAFTVASNGEALANGFPKIATVVADGNIDRFELRTSTGTPKIFGTVTLPGAAGDIELATLDYLIGQTITLTKLNYRVPN